MAGSGTIYIEFIREKGQYTMKISPKLVIFDMDGLIFDTENLFMRELGKVMMEYGYNLTRENYIQCLGLAADMVKERMKSFYGADYPCDEINSKTRIRMGEISKLDGLPVKRGIRELLKFLNDRGIICNVASSTSSEFVKEYLCAAGLDKYFHDIIGGEMVKNSKPSPDIFIKALGGEKPHNALVLEDSENGIRASYAAGIPVICIPDMVYPCNECKNLTAAVVNSAFDVIDIIEQFPIGTQSN